jgi:hypothetical protein
MFSLGVRNYVYIDIIVDGGFWLLSLFNRLDMEYISNLTFNLEMIDLEKF